MSFALFKIYLFLLQTRPFDLFAQNLASYRPMLILWILAFLPAVLTAISKKESSAQLRHYVLLSCFVLCIVMSQLVGGSASGAMSAVSDFSATALLFLLTSLNVTTLERLKSACLVILFSMFLLCVAGIAAYHYGFMSEELVLRQLKVENAVDLPKERAPIPAQDTSGYYMWRVHGVGFFDDPNDFAQAIVMALPWLLWFSQPGRWFRNLVVLGTPAAVMIYTIFLTNSRGALLGVASLVFFGIRNMLGTTRTFMMMGVLGLASTIGSFTGGRGFTSKEESARQRIEAWYEGILMLRSSPLFGVGYGNFTDRHYLTAHNSFVLCFSELGLLGYFCWIAMLVLAFKATSLVAEKAPPGSAERKAGNLLRSSFVGYVTCAWFLSRTYQPTLYVLLALCVAVWYCARRNPEVQKLEAFKAPMPWVKATFGAVAVSLSAVYAFILLDRIQQ